MEPLSQPKATRSGYNRNADRLPSPRRSALKICLLVFLLGVPLGLICGMFSVLLVWRPFLFYPYYCGPVPGTMDAIFAPDFTFGNFTIAQARAIDLSWNLFMGRGLQAIVGFASYRIVTGGLLRIAESNPMSYEVFVSTVFNTNSIVAVGTLATAIRSTHGFRFRATLTFFLLSATFILALPTLIDISTGYVQNVEKILVLTNGTRLLKNDNTCVWSNMTIGPPIYEYDGNPCSKYKDKGWIEPKEECVQTSGYQWGFSRTWILALSMFFLVWGISICGVWIDTTRSSHLYRQGIHLGKWKTISDLGKVMQEELSPHTNHEGEDGLRKRILKAAPVKYTVAHDEEEAKGLHHTLSSKPSDLQNLSSMEGPSDLPSSVNVILRLLQLSLAIIIVALNAWRFSTPHSTLEHGITLTVYVIVTSKLSMKPQVRPYSDQQISSSLLSLCIAS
jgi:hypothetical protein